MTDVNHLQLTEANERFATHYTSFVLRCWIDGRGQVHAHLLVAHSGVSHLVNDLDSLPELVRRLVSESFAPVSP